MAFIFFYFDLVYCWIKNFKLYVFFQNTCLSWKTSHLAFILPNHKPCHYGICSPPSKPGFVAHLWVWGCGVRAGLGVLRDQGQMCLHRRIYLREHDVQWGLENKIMSLSQGPVEYWQYKLVQTCRAVYWYRVCLYPVKPHESIFLPSTVVGQSVLVWSPWVMQTKL